MARRPPGRWMVVMPLLLALAGAVAVLAMDRENGLLAMRALLAEVGSAEERVTKLDAERMALIDRVRGLRSSPFEIEAAARDRLGMVRPGEVVVRLAPLETGSPQ